MFRKTVLKNGLKIVTCPIKSTRSVTVLILVGAGTKYEKKEKNGISHFLEHMYFKGTKKRKRAIDITKEIEGVGGIMNAFTSKDYTGYFIKVDYSHLKLALDVVSDIFLNSTFKEEEIERERGVILEEIKMYEDMPMAYIETIWEKLLYDDQPAGWNTVGKRETVLKIKRDDFLKYIKDYYVGPNTVIGIAGRFDEEKTIPLVKNYFSSVRKICPKKKKPVKEKQKTPQKLFFKKDTQQTHLVVGTRAFSLLDKRRYVLQVLSVILGGNMSSRLFQELREKRGLAYYVHTRIEINPDTGYLATFTGIDHKQIENVASLILEEYKKIAKEGPSEIEIKRAKENIKGLFRLSFEESDNVASFFATQALLENKILTPEEKIKAIDKVTKKDIIEVSRDIFSAEKLNLAAISPKEKKLKNFNI